MNDPVADALGRTLRQHAEDAPSDDALLTGVRAGLRRRRRRRATATAAAVLAVAAVPSALWLTSSAPREAAPVAAPAPKAPQEGWTTVVYRGVEVRVPEDWSVQIGPQDGLDLAREADKAVSTRASKCLQAGYLADGKGAVVAYSMALRQSAKEDLSSKRLASRVIDGVEVVVFTDDPKQRRLVLDSLHKVPK